MATTIKMPQLGESVTEGTIERWLVKEGDTVEQYDPLFEVVTDKVNAEVPAEIAGTVIRILVADGETVAVGTPVAEIDADGAGAATEDAAPAAEAAPATEAAPAEDAAPVASAEETTAAAEEAPAQAEAEPDAGPAVVEEQESAPQAAGAESPQPESQASEAPDSAAEDAPDATGTPAPTAGNGAARMTPAVRRLVREHDIDVEQLRGSGAGGRVTRDDVLAFIERGPQPAAAAAPAQPAEAAAPQAPSEAPEAQLEAVTPPAEPAPAPPAQPKAAAPAPISIPAPTGGDTELPLSQMREGIARKMTQVKQTVPHAYTVVEVDMTSVVRWREANNMAFKAREGASLSYVAVVVKTATETLRKHPTVNSQFADDRIILKPAMNIGIAVAGDKGLIVQVIANADQLSISGVNARIRDISSRAHSGKLRLDELQGGTFTVNNTGL